MKTSSNNCGTVLLIFAIVGWLSVYKNLRINDSVLPTTQHSGAHLAGMLVLPVLFSLSAFGCYFLKFLRTRRNRSSV
jgi:hypothetical protein